MPTSSQILRKASILSNLVDVRRRLLRVVSKLSKTQQVQVFLGVWSVTDLLAHFIGWDHTNLGAVQSLLEGKLPAFYEHRDRDWQTYNALLVRKYKKGSLEELVAAAQASQQELIDFLQAIPPENFNKDFGVRFRGYKVTIQRLLEAETKDEQTHHQQVIDFFKESY